MLTDIMTSCPTPTQQAVAAVRQPLALTDVEAQMVSLVGGGVLVVMQ